jgi:sugar phosphate isomerase/epimerase
MKLAISNIAWEKHDDPHILRQLINNSVSGIEIAPTKLWPDWRDASYQRARQYKKIMQKNGFEIPAMQAIMFGKPELQLFNKGSHPAFLDHIRLISDLANGFESKVLVFGAPKNRRRGQIPHAEAMNMAAEFFYKAGEICAAQECCIGLEHNPVEYGCDFVTNVQDAKELVDRVNHRGFKLHIDSAGLHMCGGDISKILPEVGEFVHYHISEPMLAPIVDGEVDQAKGINTLRKLNYKHWVSIEMRQPSSVELLVQSVESVRQMVFDK